MNDWKKLHIGEAILFNPPESIPKGTIAKKIPMGSLTEFKRKINSFELSKYNSGPKFRNGDTLLAKITPCIENGKTAFVDILEEDEVAFGSSEFTVLRETEHTIPEYIYYLATSPTFRKRAISCMEGTSGRKRVSEKTLKLFELEFPPIPIQKSIAKVLSDLDAKIELNNKINAELEAMAKLIYDYWFVQFDFPDKNGKPYKSSGGKMVFNEELKREIPKGWEVEKLNSCCKIIDCLHSKKSDYSFEDEKYYLLQLENIKNNGLIDLTKKYYVSKDEYKRWTARIEVQDHDLVITNAGRVAGLSQIPEGVVAGIGRNITAIRPDAILPTFLYYTFQGAEMERQIKLNTDTGSFFKSLNVRGIKELFVIRPPKKLEDSFEKIALKHRRKRELNSKQNQKLSELRDWLLPMLMNGQVTLRQAQGNAVGEAEEKLQMNMAAEARGEYKKK